MFLFISQDVGDFAINLCQALSCALPLLQQGCSPGSKLLLLFVSIRFLQCAREHVSGVAVG
jgi:hypothetical protein